MNLRRILTVLCGLTVVAGLVLVLLPDSDLGWFTYAPETETEEGFATGITFADATLMTDRDLYGYLLIAMAAVIGAGLLGYRLGSRRTA